MAITFYILREMLNVNQQKRRVYAQEKNQESVNSAGHNLDVNAL